MSGSDDNVVLTKNQKFELKRKMDHLKEIKGSGTQLISVLIPDSYPVHEVVNKLKGELSQASNIKSRQTRNNVCSALEKVLGFLKNLNNKLPVNGIAIYCGDVSNNPAKVDIQLYTIIPPVPLNVQAYRCDSTFFIEPFENIVEHTDVYGVLAMDGRHATLAYLKGTQIIKLKEIRSMAHAKIHVGGQSANRYQRLIIESIYEYHKKVSKYMSQYYLPNQVKGVLIGGPGPTKENFIKANLFNYQINVIGPLFDVGYTDEAGIRAIVNKAEDVISEQESTVERQMIERFITEAVKNGLVAYGLKAVIDNIKMFKADSVLISEGLEYNIDVYNSDEGEQIRILKDGEEPKGKKVQLMDYLVELADEHNMEYHFISMETTEGAQFKSMFFGIGVFLRYK